MKCFFIIGCEVVGNGSMSALLTSASNLDNRIPRFCRQASDSALAPKARYTLFVNITNRGTKLFFRRIKYCWRKQDERVAVHCSLFAINFRAADNFFRQKNT